MTGTLHHILHEAEKAGASMVMLKPGMPPIFRMAGELRPMNAVPLIEEECEWLCTSLLSDAEREELAQEKDWEGALRGWTTFRANLFHSRGAVCGVFTRNVFDPPSPPPPDPGPWYPWLGPDLGPPGPDPFGTGVPVLPHSPVPVRAGSYEEELPEEGREDRR